MNARTGVWVLAAVVLAATGASGISAQEDFRHVDEGRPTRVEDAYPLKFLEWEMQLGGLGMLAAGDERHAGGVFELKVGAAPNLQLGFESHGAWERQPAGDANGIESFGAHVLFNLNQEGRRSPAVAVRTDLHLPGFGDLARDAAGGRLKMMGTRSLGASRIHVNVARSWSSRVDGGDTWGGGVAIDRPIGLSGRAIVADVFFEAPDDGGPTRVWMDGGMRIQISRRSVLDVGVAVSLDEWADGRENLGLVIGLSRAFGLAGLVRVPPYPEPALR